MCNNFSDIEILATLMIQHMGGKIELVDNMFYVDDEDFSDSDRIVTNNRHSWHANTWVFYHSMICEFSISSLIF